MKDSYKYSDGERWTYKRDWFNPRISKAPSKCWKDQRKSRHQYKRTAYIDLYEALENASDNNDYDTIIELATKLKALDKED